MATKNFKAISDVNMRPLLHNAIKFCGKMSLDEFSDNEMPHDSSDEEVWEEEEMSSDEDSDCGPGFSAPTQRAPGLHMVLVLCLHSSLSEIRHFLIFSAKITIF